MFNILQYVMKHSKCVTGVHNHIRKNGFSSAPITVSVRNTECEGNSPGINLKKDNPPAEPNGYNSLVAAAFASLKEDTVGEIRTPFTDTRIAKAATVGELLSISDGSGVSRRHALKVVSILADWSTSGKVQLSEFESDPRFIKLCKILTKTHSQVKRSYVDIRNEDLTTVLNITADEEAAKLISSISLMQMVKIMSALCQKRRRSTPLLRALAFNITRSSETLDLKQCADILYSSAALNFIDENLLQKICADVCASLESVEKGSAAIGSILTSLGLLKYKNLEILNALSDWVVKNQNICRSQDIFSLFITLANLNHQPHNAEEMFEVLVPQLKDSETMKPTVWLDAVWALLVLNRITNEHASSILTDTFVKQFEADSKSNFGSKLKLLNIDSACDLLIKGYNGPRLPIGSSIRTTEIPRSRDKSIMISIMIDSLSSLVNPESHLKTLIDTKMGFYIDAQVCLDDKCNPIPLSKQTSSEKHTNVAIVGYDFYDMCIGRVEPTGMNALFQRFLKAQGYYTLIVPYTEFNTKDKLVKRVKYLEEKLKSVQT